MNKKQYKSQQDAFLKTVAKIARFALAAAKAFRVSMTSIYLKNFEHHVTQMVENSMDAKLVNNSIEAEFKTKEVH